MCITMPPAPPATTYPPVTRPPAPPPPMPLPPTSPGIPPSPPAPPPATLLDLVNSAVIAPNGVATSFQKLLADGGVLMTYTNSGTASCIIRVVTQNNSSEIATAVPLTLTCLSSGAATFTPQSPITVTIPANNYSTTNVTMLANTEGTINAVVSIGTTNVTLPIAFYNLNP